MNARLWRNLGIGGLGLVVGACAYILLLQVLLLFVPLGSWQRPGISRVTVLQVESDPQNLSMDPVKVRQGEQERWFMMLKAEAAELEPDETIWVLNNIHPTPMRPAQFRLTLRRLLLEYPEPLLILALWGIRRLRRAQVKAEAEAQPKVRRVITDDFHARAQRFASAPVPEALSASAHQATGKQEEPADQAEGTLHGEAQQAEGQQKQPDQRV